MPDMDAPDLTQAPPRPLDAELHGYAWLPRMLDKARATLAGTQGSYMFGCPVDHTCMARLGISPGELLEIVRVAPDDDAVLEALSARGIPSAREAWFDGQAVEDELLQTETYLRVRRAADLRESGAARVFAGHDHGAGVSVAVIDAQPGSGEPMHTHPTEEVTVVCSGQATFSLGRWQARIVRAGEIVRVPAGVVHRYENTGAQRLCAVAAYGADTIVSAPMTVTSPARLNAGHQRGGD